MNTKLATAGLLIGALFLPLTGYTAAHTSPAKAPASTSETASSSDTKAAPKSGKRSSQPVSDSVITTKVKALFAKDKQVSALNIEVKTVDGVVTLSGTAKSKQEASKAVSVARKVKGVKKVVNEISVA